MAAKSKNPDYMQLYSYVPRAIGVKFKALCATHELEQSEVVEKLITKWIEELENEEKQKP